MVFLQKVQNFAVDAAIAEEPTFLFYAIGVHVAHDDHSFFKIETFLVFGLVLDSIIERWKLTQNDGQNVIITDGFAQKR